MAFLTLNGEYLTLDEIRLALYGGYAARLSDTGGGSGGSFENTRGGAIGGAAPSGSISKVTPGGKIGETR